MSQHTERARYFRRDYDRNRGRFDPDIELHDGRAREFYGPAYGMHEHTYDQPEEAEWSLRRENWPEDTDHTGKGPRGWRRSDKRIREDVCEALRDSYRVDATDIDVLVKDGCVFLRGTVNSRQAKREAEYAIENVRSINDVRNELRIRNLESL